MALCSMHACMPYVWRNFGLTLTSITSYSRQAMQFLLRFEHFFFFFLFVGALNPGSQKYQSSQRRKVQGGMHHAYLGRPCTRANQIMWDSYPLNPPAIPPCPERCGTAGEPDFTYTRWVPWKPCLTPEGLGSGWDTSANRRRKKVQYHSTQGYKTARPTRACPACHAITQQAYGFKGNHSRALKNEERRSPI